MQAVLGDHYRHPELRFQFGRLANAAAEMDGVDPGPDRSEHADHPR